MFKMDREDISSYLRIFLWMATLLHAGLIAWAILHTAQLPPNDQPPPGWADIFGQGATSQTFWIYVIVLAVNLFWEARIKSEKTYVTPLFPYSESSHGANATGLWLCLVGFAYFGFWNGWFPTIPAELNKTFWCSFSLWIVQGIIIERRRKTGEAEKPAPAAASNEAPAANPVTETPKPSDSPSGAMPPPVNRSNAELTAELLAYIRQNGEASTTGLVEKLGSPRRSVIRTLNKLLVEGRLVRKGHSRAAVYRFKEKPGPGNERWN